MTFGHCWDRGEAHWAVDGKSREKKLELCWDAALEQSSRDQRRSKKRSVAGRELMLLCSAG